MRRSTLLLIFATGLELANFPVQALGIYVPTQLRDVEGNFSGIFFGVFRYQQVYDALEFGAIPPPGHFIEALTFRLNTPSQTFNINVPDLEVLLSTTSRGPDNLSTNFDENSGADLTRVIERGNQQVAGFYAPLSQVQGFNIMIFPLDRPFFYDPSRGHLLLEIRNYVAVTAAAFDIENTMGDSISSVIATNPAAAIGIVASSGLPTFINTREIPELEIGASSTNLLLRWLNFPQGFRLESARRLGTNVNWNYYPSAPSTNGDFLEVSVPRTQLTNAEYFRIRWDPTYVTNSPVPGAPVGSPTKLNP